MHQFVLVVLLVVGVLLTKVASHEPVEKSFRLPSIFLYDDFDRCQAKRSVYCYARTVLRNDQLPAGYVLPPIDSTNRIVYNHRPNFLELGICLAECEKELEKLSLASRDALFQPEIRVNYTIDYVVISAREDPHENFHGPIVVLYLDGGDLSLYKFQIPHEMFPTMRDDKVRYETLVNVCVNRRLSTQYNLTGYTALEYCRPEPGTASRSFDGLELLFLAISAGLIGVLVVSTFADLTGARPDSSIVSAFSIRRNWNRLLEKADSELHRDLVYIDGLRVVVNHLVIILHSFLVSSAAPSKNYDTLERLLDHVPMLIYLSSNAFLVQVFFTISGYLLSVNFLRDAGRKEIDARYFWNRVLNRLVRLLPVYGYFLLFSVSLNARFDINANGYRLFTAENAICRQNWWANLFFVNNFIWPSELCLMHTWYLAADFQLFLMAMVLLLVLHRWPKIGAAILLTTVLASFAIPAYITHEHKLHPVMPAKLSEVKFICMHEPWIRRLYLPSYANTGSYIFGIIAGYLYHWTKNHKLQLHRYWLYRSLDKCATIVLVAVMLSSSLWYFVDVPKPNIWVSLYSALYRNVLGVFVSVCFLRCINTPPGMLRRFLSSRLLATLGKLTYSVYVLHDVVMRLLLLRERVNTEISVQKFVLSVYVVNVLGFAAGLVVFLVIEQPMIQLIKPLVNRISSPVGTKPKVH